MNKNLTEMVFILDRSGSMSHLEADTIGGYNSLLEQQKKEEGEAVVTTVLFDDKYELVHDRADIKKVSPLTDREYFARGLTALLDAIGKTVNHIKERHKYAPDGELPGKTVVVIITDGFENASSEFTKSQIKSLIESQKEECGWEFLFLGANIDAVSTARDYGIACDRAVKYEADNIGTMINFAAVSKTVSCVREEKPISPAWKKDIEAHLKKKKGK